MAESKVEHLLDSIHFPEDLRHLSQDKLEQVCADLRQYIIDVLSENPGHLGASLGTVELTVALHYVFNTPYDRIVWDVGHQAYGHKILTGRKDIFHTLRKFKGISGFPNPAESEYDAFIRRTRLKFNLCGDGYVGSLGLEEGTGSPCDRRDRGWRYDRRTRLRGVE